MEEQIKIKKRHSANGRLPLWGGGIFALPVIVFIACAVGVGLPTETIVSAEIFKFQYAMTMLTIIAIPLLLWSIRKERFRNVSTYKIAAILRLLFFEVLTLVDIAAYFTIPNVTFFYLAVITYLSMFFARK